MTWAETIKGAKERGKFTHAERLAACRWETCAISERAFTPMVPGGTTPADPVLVTLGLRFAEHVDHQDFEQAEATLDSIEARTKPKAP